MRGIRFFFNDIDIFDRLGKKNSGHLSKTGAGESSNNTDASVLLLLFFILFFSIDKSDFSLSWQEQRHLFILSSSLRRLFPWLPQHDVNIIRDIKIILIIYKCYVKKSKKKQLCSLQNLHQMMILGSDIVSGPNIINTFKRYLTI